MNLILKPVAPETDAPDLTYLTCGQQLEIKNI